ncbi:hypothetical protein RR48_04890 [Papilio machaon]|uniref:Uncharacterized protein n=1 Tax=Papilio machaon TaxID=76193 RepID=A0A0N1ID09_PAPMA|nr:hypothetical protein RR48_04890 [Papilio machaon]
MTCILYHGLFGYNYSQNRLWRHRLEQHTGCKCPCGQKVAPAFYLVPSKVEWSNIVQNVQITV